MVRRRAPNTSSGTVSPRLRRLQQVSHVLDNAIPIPGSKIRIGIDPILGLLPGAGDTLTGLMSVYI
ncbi:MAG: DUF4112 domain-containing protein, partial [Phormidesmis sp.]